MSSLSLLAGRTVEGHPSRHTTMKQGCIDVYATLTSIRRCFDVMYMLGSWKWKFSKIFEKQASLARKCHNLRPQTNPWHREEETQNTDTHSTARTVKMKQPTIRYIPQNSFDIGTSQYLLLYIHIKGPHVKIPKCVHLYCSRWRLFYISKQCRPW